MELRDGNQRKLSYLRISVTDRCNLRCSYCMPSNGVKLISHDQILRLEEIYETVTRFVRIFGINKIRITGGEPLLRRNIEWLIDKLSKTEGINDLALTTNGSLLIEKAAILYYAGLRRINVSIDSLNAQKYHDVTRGGNLEKVLAGIDIAKKIGFSPIKINVVLYPGFNEEHEFIEWGNKNSYVVRFIELMPNANIPILNSSLPTMKMHDLIKSIEQKYGKKVEEIEGQQYSGKHALRFSIGNTNQIFEIIPSVSSHFCDVCNRLRLNSEGHIRFCLFSNEYLDIKPLLAKSDNEFSNAIINFVQNKNDSRPDHIGSFMSSIGG